MKSRRTLAKKIGVLFVIITVFVFQSNIVTVFASNSTNDFVITNNTLIKYTGTATSVSVPDGVVKIGSEAFANQRGISAISFPSTLKVIERDAFYNCDSLYRAYLPDGFTTLGDGAFSMCDTLADVKLGANISSIGSGAFASASKLKTVSIDSKNSYFSHADGVIYSADKKEVIQMLAGREKSDYSMPSTVEAIHQYAFWGCKNLESIGFSSNLKKIPAYAFSNCSSLLQVAIPYSVQSIDIKAFENCSKLTKVVIPESVRSIHPSAFDGCVRYVIEAPVGSKAYEFYEAQDRSNTEIALQEDELVEEQTKEKVVETSELSSEPSVTSDFSGQIVDGDLIGQTQIVTKQALMMVDTKKIEVFDGQKQNPSENTVSGTDASSDQMMIADAKDSLNIDKTRIKERAFYLNSQIKGVTIPNTVDTLGDFSFARSTIKSIQLPESVKHIGVGSFYYCKELSSIYIPTTVETIEPDAFTNTKWYNNWRENGDVDPFLIVGDGILIGYKGNNSNLTIPDNVKKIGPKVFENNDQIQKVTIPDSVQVIEEAAFANCTSLKLVSGGVSVTAIKDRAFYNCPLTDIRIHPLVETIGLGAYYDTTQKAAYKTIHLLGSKIPKISYEKSAKRIANVDYRIPVFNENTNVIVSGTVADMKETIFDSSKLGHKGCIYEVLELPTSGTTGSLSWIGDLRNDTTKNLAKTIMIDGLPYQIGETNLSLKSESVSQNSNTNYEIVTTHPQISQNSVIIKGLDTSSNYILAINPSEEALNQLSVRIQDKYGAFSKDAFVAMDLSLMTQKGEVPIEKLGNSPIELHVKVPESFLSQLDRKELCVATTNANNDLEIRFVNLYQENNETWFSVSLDHFSSYGIYLADGELSQLLATKKGQQLKDATLDDTPDTGEQVDPKWILGAGFFLLAAYLIIRKKMKS